MNFYKIKFLTFSYLLFFILALSSCGYKPYRTPLTESGQTITVNYVEGDINGKLTEEIINEVARNIPLVYVNKEADFVLNVKILNYKEKNVSFTFKNEDKKSFANEKRGVLRASFELTNTLTGRTVIGPIEVKAEEDFDFDQDPGSEAGKVNLFGVLDMGQDSSKEPLYKGIAQKITNYVLAYWQ
jgi:hypothetical protein